MDNEIKESLKDIKKKFEKQDKINEEIYSKIKVLFSKINQSDKFEQFFSKKL